MSNIARFLESEGLLKAKKNDSNSLNDASWFIVTFHVLGGILSAIVILTLLYFLFPNMLDSPFAIALLGFLFLIFSTIILLRGAKPFIEYLALTFAFIGGLLLYLFLSEIFHLKDYSKALLLTVFYFGLFFLIPSLIHRFISALVVLSSLYYLSFYLGLDRLYSDILLILLTLLWLNEYKSLKYSQHKRMFAYAMTLFILFFISNYASIEWNNFYYIMRSEEVVFWNISISSMFIFYYLTPIVAMVMLLLKLNIKWNSLLFWGIIVGTIFFLIIQFGGISFVYPLMVTLLGFYSKNRLLMGLGILGIIYNLIYYYTFIYIDFISKSKFLLIFGISLFFLALVLHLYLEKKGEKDA